MSDENKPWTVTEVEAMKLAPSLDDSMRRALATIRHHEAEAAALRGAMLKAGRHAGAMLSDEVSSEFLVLTADEIVAELDALREEVRGLEAVNDLCAQRAEAAEKARDEALAALERVKARIEVEYENGYQDGIAAAGGWEA